MSTAIASGVAGGRSARVRAIATPTTIAMVGIWGAAVAIALFSPDLVSGSEQEHIPLGALTIWFYAGLATAFILTAAAAIRGGETDTSTGWWTATVWVAVALASIFGPEMVTGSDPTRIPIAVLVAPIIGMVTTGFIAIIEAGRKG